jgi:hypothetical protein
MSDYLEHLLKRRPAAGATDVDGDEPKIRDADGKQLVQPKNDAHGELADWEDLPKRPAADLDLTSTDRRRAARSRKLRKRT